MAIKGTNKYRRFFYITAIFMFFLSEAAFSMIGLHVRPMVIEITPYPGMKVQTDLEIRNASEQSQLVNFELHDLTQSENASWKILEPEAVTPANSEYSCKDWITLEKQTVTVGPLQTTAIKVKLKVPPKTQGFYLAGITATLQPAEAKEGIGMAVRFLVPVLIQIRARAVREDVVLEDVGMQFIEETSRTAAKTVAVMTIANEGKTYAKIKGNALLKKRVGDKWRRITEIDFVETKIIPGIHARLVTTIDKQLPSGQYQLFGQLEIGGRRAKPIEKEIEFVGDPSISQAATDAAIEISPQDGFVETIPGATRAIIFQVTNASDTAVDISAAQDVPTTLKGVAFGNLKGEDLACPQWLKVSPDNFSLRPGARKNIRIMAKMPSDETPHANYYASLNLYARYTNGQNAGKQSALICVHNKNLDSYPQAQVMKLSVSAEKASRNIITATFGNVGNVHFKPNCRAMIVNSDGKISLQMPLKGNLAPMFPLELREFSEVFDLSGFAPGDYYVEAFIEYGTGQVANAKMPIRVTVEGPDKIVEIIDQNNPDTR